MEGNPNVQQAVRPNVTYKQSTQMLSIRTAGSLAAIGILLFFIGLLLFQSSSFIQMKSIDDMNLYRNLIAFSQLLSYIGVMLITLPLYLTGITNNSLDWKVRATMVSSATAIIIASMIIVMFAGSMASASMASYYTMSNMMGGF